jgi:hypothetical protein
MGLEAFNTDDSSRTDDKSISVDPDETLQTTLTGGFNSVQLTLYYFAK